MTNIGQGKGEEAAGMPNGPTFMQNWMVGSTEIGNPGRH